MSKVEEIVVHRPEFDELVERVDRLERKVDDGFTEMKKFEARTETQFFEIRRELAHHSEILTSHGELLKSQGEQLTQLQQGLDETCNMVKKILDIAERKA